MRYQTETSYDVLIIGAGVIGCAIARELSRYDLRIGVIEKEGDVSLGISCRNSGVLHSGINYKPGSLRARLCVRGNAMMDVLCKELRTPIRRIGKLTVALDGEDMAGLHKLHEQGRANGVPGMELFDNEAMSRIQPGIAGVLGLWTPSSAIVSPYGLTIALAENSIENGVRYFLNSEVCSIVRRGEGFDVTARGGLSLSSRLVINASGLSASDVARLAGVSASPIWPCRGEYYVLDKRLASSLNTLVYPVPGPNDPGLGIHLTPTIDGNILIGPSASYLPADMREDYRTTAEVMKDLRREGRRLLPSLEAADFIRSFSGNRPKQTPPEVGGNEDFTISAIGELPGFIQLQGIESPGLTSSLAIAEMVTGLVQGLIPLRPVAAFKAERAGWDRLMGSFSSLPLAERQELAAADPEYGEIFCRCEQVTKREIRNAIENPLGAHSLAAIKYRTRAMMGRCQGGFCVPRLVRFLREEYGFAAEDYFLRGEDSPLFAGVRQMIERVAADGLK